MKDILVGPGRGGGWYLSTRAQPYRGPGLDIFSNKIGNLMDFNGPESLTALGPNDVST